MNDFDGSKFGNVPLIFGSFGAVSRGVTRPEPVSTGGVRRCGATDRLGVTSDGIDAAPFSARAAGATQATAPPPLMPEQLHVQGP